MSQVYLRHLNQDSGQNVNRYWSFSKHRIEVCHCYDHAAAYHVLWLTGSNLFTALRCPST